jgi:hypothetical protein
MISCVWAVLQRVSTAFLKLLYSDFDLPFDMYCSLCPSILCTRILIKQHLARVLTGTMAAADLCRMFAVLHHAQVNLAL